ncbi:MAG: T9SS type A sorting domain-containing protein [Bacteroidetes bacterium]|nr:T9SS type A sorting domain-containing protein [Bacteroidota bacterium]
MLKSLRPLLLLFIGLGFSFFANAQNDPKADMNINNPYVCEGQSIRFFNRSKLYDSIVWHMGNGDTSKAEKFDYLYTNPKNGLEEYTVMLIAYGNNTADTAIKKVTVQAHATAFFKDSIIATWVQFFHESKNYIGLSWDFGDKQTSLSDNPKISHLYASGGTYNVVLIANTDYQCNDTFSKTIVLVDSSQSGSVGDKNPYKMEIYPNPIIDFSIFAFNNNAEKALKISISDATGRVLFYQHKRYVAGTHRINLGELIGENQTGFYIISIADEKSTYILKSIKN